MTAVLSRGGDDLSRGAGNGRREHAHRLFGPAATFRGPSCSWPELDDVGKFVKVVTLALRKIQTVGSTFSLLMLSFRRPLAAVRSLRKYRASSTSRSVALSSL